MDSLKQYRKAIDLAVYGVALLCTLLFAVYSVWGFGISGFTILFEASFIEMCIRDRHNIVLQGHIEPRRTRIPLAAGPAPQLVIDAPALVALGTDDMESAHSYHLLMLLVANLSLIHICQYLIRLSEAR